MRAPLAFLLLLAGCQCNPVAPPDGGQPVSLAWPAGAQLRLTATTATGASLSWPTALGPVDGYRLSAPGPASTTATTADLTGLAPGKHVRLSVVAFGAGGAETPPLSAEVAPAAPLVPGPGDISTDFCGANAFLVRGAPIPCDVFSVLIGHVRTRDGVGVPGLSVSVLNHPEWGAAVSQADGQYALAIEAGARTVAIGASSFLPIQRFVTAPARGFTYVPDTVVVRRDEKSTAISPAQGGFHKATAQTDRDGTRTTAVFIPASTAAVLRFADGGTQPAATLTLRATEATVGPSGPEAMPASLPAATAYTFAADVSADEALAAGAVGVGFGAPVALYADNFLKFPVGAAIPLGLYDEVKGRWESAPNAVVITVGGTIPGALPGEAEALGANFAAGTQLVRSTTTHFSTFDTNPCSRCVGSCVPNGTASTANRVECPTCAGGSLIRLENRTLSEFAPVSGTGFQLAWHSNRGNVRSASVDLKLGLLDDGGTPEKVQGTYFRVEVAGRTLVDERIDGGVGDSAQITWDGKDAFGRAVQGPVAATGSTGYGFGAVSVESSSGPGGIVNLEPSTFGVWPPPGAREFSSTREALYYLQHTSLTLGDWVPRENLGNLSLDVVHGYSEDGTVHLGGGGETSAREAGPLIRFVAGGGFNFGEDAGVLDVGLGASPQLADSPAGLVYIENGRRIRLLRPDAGVVTIAGDMSTGFADGPGPMARFANPSSVETDPAGNVYVADVDNHRIRRIDARTGEVTTVIGSGQQGVSPDGTAALAAKLDQLSDLLVSREGILYFVTSDGMAGALLRRLEADGTITTVAGGSPVSSPPWEAASPRAIGFRGGAHWLGEDADRRLYVAGYDSGGGTSTYVVRRIDPDGSVHLLAGAGTSTDPAERVAAKTCFSGITGMAVADDGTVYVSENGFTGCGVRGAGIRILTPDGSFQTFIGGTKTTFTPLLPPDGVAASTLVNGVGELTFRRDGSLAIVHRGPATTLHAVAFPQAWAARAVPSRDGDEVYVFDGQGRHLRTVSARTGTVLLTFSWDDHGLASITDVDGEVTKVERTADGSAKALVAPDGQRTELALSNGRVTRITDAAGRFVEAAYLANGLLSEWKDANGHATKLTWDPAGNLLTHTDARGGKRTLSATPTGVELTSAEGRVSELGFGRVGGDTTLQSRGPDGMVTGLIYGGGAQLLELPDGTRITTTMQPAPSARFGRSVNVPGTMSVKLPSGLEGLVSESRTTVAGATPLSVASEVDEVRMNGRLWRRTFDGATKTHEVTSPAGRVGRVTLDAKDHPLALELPGRLPVAFAWDARGRLTGMSQGTRSMTYTLGPGGYVASMKNALNETAQLATDATGRLLNVTRADAKVVSWGHDSVGNVTGVTPPDRGVHTFGFSATDEATTYTPPPLTGVGPLNVTYDLDHEMTAARHADATTSTVTRDAAGRMTELTTPHWKNVFAYSATTGQRTSVTRGPQRLDWVYDGFLRTRETATGVAPAVSAWAYDSDFRLSAHSIAGASISYAYDADSLPTQVGAATLTRVPATGDLASVAVGAVTTALTYDGFGCVTMRATAAGATPIYSEGLSYDGAGRVAVIEEIVEGVPTQWTYTHDAVGRLTSAAKNGGAPVVWAYDGNGNRVSAGGAAATFDAHDRLLTRGTATYAWDAHGGRLSKTEAGITTLTTHDWMGALLTVTRPGVTIAYDFDGKQRRVARRKNGAIDKRWVYDGPTRIAAEVDAAGAITARFVYGSQPHSPDYVVKGGTTYALVKNHVGSVRLVVDAATGAVAQRLDYDAWGVVVQDTAPGFQPFGFAGGLYDPDTGLTHFGLRDYDAESGTWTSKDPLGLAAGNNAYAYVENAPLHRVDATGAWWTYDIRYSRYEQLEIEIRMMEAIQTSKRARKGMHRLLRDQKNGVHFQWVPDDFTEGEGGVTSHPLPWKPTGGQYCIVRASPAGHVLALKQKGISWEAFGQTPLSLTTHEIGHAVSDLYGDGDWQVPIDWENDVKPKGKWRRSNHRIPYHGPEGFSLH